MIALVTGHLPNSFNRVMINADDEKENDMNWNIKTYQDVQALYLAIGWGCKCCGRLNSAEWHESSGDTYCAGCKNHIKAELPDAQFTQYPQGTCLVVIQEDPDSQGFDVAANMRQEHERVYGYLPDYTGQGGF